MKHRIGKEPKGGSKKRKEVWNDNTLASMFANQQAASEQTNQEKNTMHSFRKEKKLGWRTQAQAVKAEPVRRSEKDTHDIEGTETGAYNSAKTQCRLHVFSKAFHFSHCLWDECARRPDSLTISRLHHHLTTDYTGG